MYTLLPAVFCYTAVMTAFEERWLTQVYPGYADYRKRAGRFLPILFKSAGAR
jgi:protein-S-isoprenylcysteine O-methyltransferase Ste14